MPERSRDWVWGAAGLAALVAVVVVLAPPPRQVATDIRLSTLRTTPDGAGALYGMLEALGVPVDRRVTPLAGAAGIRGPLAVLDPTERLSPSEVDSLLSWVESGGRLMLAPPPGHITDRLGVFVRHSPADSALEAVPGHPWTADLGRVTGAGWVLRPDPRADVRIEPLVAGPGGGAPAIALISRGAGEILLISQGSLLANGRIRATGVAPIIARAAADWTAGGDTLWFDEYHHGHRGGSPHRALASFLARAGPGRAAVQLVLVALLALLPAIVRFGAPAQRPPAERRSRLEHAAALGEVYRQARAADVARRRLLAGFARRIGRERPEPGGELAFLDRLGQNVATGADAVAAVAAAWRDRRPVTELARRIDEAVNRLNPER